MCDMLQCQYEPGKVKSALNQLSIKYAILNLPIGNTIRKVLKLGGAGALLYLNTWEGEGKHILSLRPAWSTSSGTELLQRNSISKNPKTNK